MNLPSHNVVELQLQHDKESKSISSIKIGFIEDWPWRVWLVFNVACREPACRKFGNGKSRYLNFKY